MDASLLLIIILAYFGLLLGIAFYTSRHADNESFFIGNRNSRWWVVAFGMIGTSLSGMTFISVPGTVGAGAFGYFQVVIGYWLGYFVVAYVLLPLYYKLQLTSIYTYLEGRLGTSAYKTGALFFILSRTLGATLRLYLVIKVLDQFVLKDLNISFEWTAVVILLLILLYTYRGGVKTIVWTDTLQTTFMLLALVICIVYILQQLNLNFPDAWKAMQLRGYTNVISTDPMAPSFFLKQILGGAFITIAMTGLDQEMMQKNISVSTLQDAQKNMITFCFTLLAANFLFLWLGGLLSMYAQTHQLTATGDQLFPTVALKSGLPFFITVCFLIGLISALFPSADGALTALTSSFCIDIVGMGSACGWTEDRKKRTRLLIHYSFAAVFLVCVFVFREVDQGSLIQTLLLIAGYTYGPLLGLFSFGILTRRMPHPVAVPVIAVVAPLICYQLKQHDQVWLSGYVIGHELLVINAAITFGMLLLSSYRRKEVSLRQ